MSKKKDRLRIIFGPAGGTSLRSVFMFFLPQKNMDFIGFYNIVVLCQFSCIYS